ncbi:MAG TPA: DNA polymerase III subunit beta [Acidobacteriota bacterium]|nr:DNA polymerase III subunit beta [Acidobacteriota bacterium]
MDLSVSRSRILRELQFVQGVVERKTTVPVLANALLETKGNQLTVTASDLDVTLRCSCAADIRVAGALSVPARKLFDIIRLLPESDVHMKALSSDWMQITCSRARFKIPSLPKESFPVIPAVTGDGLNLPADALRRMIPRCSYAITQEETRYTLSGALLRVTPGGLTMVSSDGHRLVVLDYGAPFDQLVDRVEALVPKKTLLELGKLVAEGDAPVQFGLSQNHLFFTVEGRLMVSRVLSGRFPNYEMVIPRDNRIVMRAPTGELTEALRRVSIMTDLESRGVCMALEEGSVDLLATSPDAGTASESLPVAYEGPALKVNFNAEYLLDFLTTVESNEVDFFFKDHEAQVLVKPAKEADGEDPLEYSYVIMPLK